MILDHELGDRNDRIDVVDERQLILMRGGLVGGARLMSPEQVGPEHHSQVERVHLIPARARLRLSGRVPPHSIEQLEYELERVAVGHGQHADESAHELELARHVGGGQAASGDEACVEVAREQRLRQRAQVLFEQAGGIVRVEVLV